MAVGKGSILRASNAAKKTETAKADVIKEEVAAVKVEETAATRMVPIELLVIPPADWKQADMSKEEKLELKASIEKYGVLQPLLIWKKQSDRKQELIIVDGLKRKLLAEELRLTQLPVVTVEAPDEESAREICLEIERLAALKNQKRKYRNVEGIPSKMPSYLL